MCSLKKVSTFHPTCVVLKQAMVKLKTVSCKRINEIIMRKGIMAGRNINFRITERSVFMKIIVTKSFSFFSHSYNLKQLESTCCFFVIPFSGFRHYYTETNFPLRKPKSFEGIRWDFIKMTVIYFRLQFNFWLFGMTVTFPAINIWLNNLHNYCCLIVILEECQKFKQKCEWTHYLMSQWSLT